MWRNIKTLFNFEPPVTPEEVEAASLQFVRKISGARWTPVLPVVLALWGAAANAQDPEPRELRQVFASNSFSQPLFLTHAGDGSDRVFIVEKGGRVKVMPNRDDAVATVFLDLSAVVNTRSEGGLLGLAFHPEYQRAGRLYVYYTHGDLTSRVSEFRVSADPDVVDATSERVLWEVSQPAANHNGGQVTFGPDGMLYIGLGDGGGANDRFENGQDPTTWLAAILRIDVDERTGDLEYGIPPDNPFVDNEADWREEIWAYGLRNPWRFSFDRTTGQLWAGDVGQNRLEEVDLIEKGGNYGWSIMEGFSCFSPASDCDQEGLVPPVLEYGRGEGASVTGGYVYRGRTLGSLYGAYVYGDFVSGRIWGLRYDGGVTDHAQIATCPCDIASFGEDERGEVFIVGLDGVIYTLEPLPGEGPTNVELADQPLPAAPALRQNFPNPFNTSTTIAYTVPRHGPVELDVFDLLGRPVKSLAAGAVAPGNHTVVWDGADEAGRRVGSGVYLYRLRVHGFEETHKMAQVE